MEMRSNWVKVLKIANVILLLIAMWMTADGHRTAAMVLLLSSIATQLTRMTLE
jgi:hypothetical protein